MKKNVLDLKTAKQAKLARKTTDENYQAVFATSSQTEVLSQLALNPNISFKILEELAGSIYSEVRICVLANRKANSVIFRKLQHDEEILVSALAYRLAG